MRIIQTGDAAGFWTNDNRRLVLVRQINDTVWKIVPFHANNTARKQINVVSAELAWVMAKMFAVVVEAEIKGTIQKPTAEYLIAKLRLNNG